MITLLALQLVGCGGPSANAPAPTAAPEAPPSSTASTDAAPAEDLPSAAPAPEEPPSDEPPSAEDPRPDARTTGDPYSVTEGPLVEGDHLSLSVMYGGGCTTHQWTLQSGERDSDTPRTLPLTLVHDAAGDTCRALVQEPLMLALPPLVTTCTDTLLLTLGGREAPVELHVDPPLACE